MQTSRISCAPVFGTAWVESTRDIQSVLRRLSKPFVYRQPILFITPIDYTLCSFATKLSIRWQTDRSICTWYRGVLGTDCSSIFPIVVDDRLHLFDYSTIAIRDRYRRAKREGKVNAAFAWKFRVVVVARCGVAMR